jgi:hypothetical protein
VTDRPVDTDGGGLLLPHRLNRRRRRKPAPRAAASIRFVSLSTSLPSPSLIPVQFSRSLPSPLTLANAPELNRALFMGSLRAPPAPAPLVGSARVLFGSGLRFASTRVLKPRGARLFSYILLLLLPATCS